jgi:hypothetical protein
MAPAAPQQRAPRCARASRAAPPCSNPNPLPLPRAPPAPRPRPPSARMLADDARNGVISYLSVYKGSEGDKAKLGMGSNRHPSLERAHAALAAAWREVGGRAGLGPTCGSPASFQPQGAARIAIAAVLHVRPRPTRPALPFSPSPPCSTSCRSRRCWTTPPATPRRACCATSRTRSSRRACSAAGRRVSAAGRCAAARARARRTACLGWAVASSVLLAEARPRWPHTAPLASAPFDLARPPAAPASPLPAAPQAAACACPKAPTLLRRRPSACGAGTSWSRRWRARWAPGRALLGIGSQRRAPLSAASVHAAFSLTRRRPRFGWGRLPAADSAAHPPRRRALLPQAAALRRGNNRARAAALTKGLAEALFAHCYPRLDVEVTKKMNHLLKVGQGRAGVGWDGRDKVGLQPNARCYLWLGCGGGKKVHAQQRCRRNACLMGQRGRGVAPAASLVPAQLKSSSAP